MIKRLFLATLILAASPVTAEKFIEIHDAWIRHLPGDRPMAGYFVVENKGETHRTLVGATSIAFGSVHVHESVEKDGMASMRPVDAVVVPALDRVEFRPGGYHLMLMGRKQDLRVGDEVPITLEFEDGGSQAAVFAIKPSWQE